jgi:hypothetical protein
MQVFDQYIMPATIETLAEMVNKFNEASGGAIRMTTEGFTGDFLQESFWAAIHSAQRRVDRYGSNGDVAATDLSQLQHNSVKVAGGFGPIRFEPSQMTWLQKPTAEGIEVISRNFAEAMLKDMLFSTIAALVAAIEAQGTAAVHDAGAAALNYSAMNSAHAKFGDHSNQIITNIMDGIQFHALIDDNLTNDQRLFESTGIQVVDILGKLVVVTDAPALRETGADADVKVLGLVSNAAVVHDASDVISNVQTVNGKERIETTFQADYSYGLGIKGYAWDQTAGGRSPDDTALATGSNWDKVATSIKHTAGVLALADI